MIIGCCGSIRKRRAQLSYDSVVSGFDAARPILIESIEYTLWVRELGRLIRRVRRALAGPRASALRPGHFGSV